ncbi:aspartate aminotransferase family protein [Taylorella equigenitalis]|uniref:Diaminobutyrate--2-oxoglutarate transaminase n=2 Tax=Taylorella equigenitalis TaxID=29575 RepID=A0A654KGI8_TAYEM|nr:aminotransferase class III-fold pyridoxal phosphate-dependent enzyme [Taylorella equigenitalis]ADU91541.1 Acetylornithine aminotransferase [Taylorella equigenitalis MCE9]WDU53351.1 aminotransferase class III-fold pyridoxal phosphate-dependent enzyme [Taylorella equigenitalis]WDU54819.1 aminotransferase class III-fold pyridoxal phosphate-dependent enzyme [Taylorella equigenitalis]WDU56337.1 aminotransferase class III-fold pyridoxal phosphate-dependent enzyme [Taylorella equigenitalis]WEE0040
MKLFDVYSLMPVCPVRALGSRIWDSEGCEYLDFYGGHAVISIGHSHPRYVEAISEQVSKLGFYSNSVQNPLQEELARKLGEVSGYEDYSLFLCNSGAEANENALKLASFHTGRSKVIAMSEAFHGRTSGAVAITDNPSIQSPFNSKHEVEFVPRDNLDQLEEVLKKNDVAAVIMEAIQGVSGIHEISYEYMRSARELCDQYGALLILDEIQSGYGRTGKFFYHAFADVHPDLITVAKGMGNGFPIGGVLISPNIKASKGLLGTTFGGNHLACATAIAVLDVIVEDELIHNATRMGEYLISAFQQMGQFQIRGCGLMIGMEFDFNIATLRNDLLQKHHIFTGNAKSNILRLLPPLCVTQEDCDKLILAIRDCLGN